MTSGSLASFCPKKTMPGYTGKSEGAVNDGPFFHGFYSSFPNQPR